uniref:G_PROTEIN_RECEP_F1_2 domain-containing protein n=1 Tax=Ascaris lumbricoides TaxID=6252 RepID=A0A0M3I3J3_ASCLU
LHERNFHNFFFLFSCVLVVYIEPLLCSAGFVLNTACIAVFVSVSSHGYFRKTSLLLYLIAMCMCNALQMLLSVFVLILPAAEQYIPDEFGEEVEALAKINSYSVRIAYPLLLAANYASIWILTLICAQRFHAICEPWSVWKTRLQIVRNSRLPICLVITLAIGLNVIRFWELEWLDQGLSESALKKHHLYLILQEGFVYGVIVYGCPIVMLLWLNYNIIKLIHTHEVRRQRPIAEYRTALMTVFVFVFFFLCTTLAVSIRLIMIAGKGSFRGADFTWLVDLSNLLMNMNAVLMPIVCFVFTRGFRDIFFVIRFAPNTNSYHQAGDAPLILKIPQQK